MQNRLVSFECYQILVLGLGADFMQLFFQDGQIRFKLTAQAFFQLVKGQGKDKR